MAELLILKFLVSVFLWMGYWHQRADERHGNPPQGNQELLVVRDKVGRPPGELGVSKSMDVDVVDLQAQADASMPASNNNVNYTTYSNF